MLDRLLARHYYGYEVFVPPPPATAGQSTFIANNTNGSQTQQFIVPDGIYFISAVVVSTTSQLYSAPVNNGSEYVACEILRGSTPLLSTSMALGSNGVNGGNGGRRGPDLDGNYTNSSPHAYSTSGGGAAGYTGNGGNGGQGSYYNSPSTGGSGSGGGGGGGNGYGGNGSGSVAYPGGVGGGVGLLGQGNNGVGGGGIAPGAGWPNYGGSGSQYVGPYVGGGQTGSSGGDLRWKNNIAVVPGEVLTISLGSNIRTESQNFGAGCRIIYGDSRSFPNDAQNAVPTGQSLFTATNTTYTVPNGVRSICACAQQLNGSSAAVELEISGSVVLRAQNQNRIGDSGGDGGAPGSSGATTTGGGGCGGYGANGGNGGTTYASGGQPGEYYGTTGSAGGGFGAGDGGGGASHVYNSGPVFGGSTGAWTDTPAANGGSVGIQGKSSSAYTDSKYGNYGGGPPGQYGGALSYKNNITVTPGQVLTIRANGGRVRIIYGEGRSYPDNAIDL